MEPTIFNYVLPQYGFNVVKIPEQLSLDSDFTKVEFTDDKDTIFIVQGPKNRVKDLIDTEIDLNSDSLSRKFFGPDVYFAGIFLIYDTDHNLKEQLDHRVSFSSIISSINAQSGTNTIALCSLLTATKYDKDVELDKSIAYLDVFEEGIPIAVTFTKSGYANGQFLLLNDSNSYEDISEIFNRYSCKVNKIK